MTGQHMTKNVTDSLFVEVILLPRIDIHFSEVISLI